MVNEPVFIRPNIFEYVDYRLFLSDFFSFLKKSKSDFSVRALAKKIGVSPSYFTMIISRKSGLSDQGLALLQDSLGLRRDEHTYLVHMVKLSDAPNLEEQVEAYKRLTRSSLFKNKKMTDLASHKYLSNWYYVAIREMAASPDFKLDPMWIRSRLKKKISLTQIRESLDFLVSAGLILIDEKGKARASGKNVVCDGPVYKLALTEFYKQVYELAIDSIYHTDREQRYFTSHTMAVSKEKYEDIKTIVDEARERIRNLVLEESPQEKKVYHVSFLLYPFTEEL